MHATEREEIILNLLSNRGFTTLKEIEQNVSASPATLRRDLKRLAKSGQIQRVRGGAKIDQRQGTAITSIERLAGVPFDQNIRRNLQQKIKIGRAAAELCDFGEAVMIDGGSTTLQMCSHLEGRGLQVLTNSLYIVGALLEQNGTQIHMPGGAVFREQNIVLSAIGEDLTPNVYAPKLFMGAASIGAKGIMQADTVLVAVERRLIERAEKVHVLVDSDKFKSSSGHVVCGLEDVHVVITDDGIDKETCAMLEGFDIEVVIGS